MSVKPVVEDKVTLTGNPVLGGMGEKCADGGRSFAVGEVPRRLRPSSV
ncbi:MAG: hypothetical protein JWN91_4472 [Nocardioides sp.]|jgi:hypothetical protein|nr:hypothetical protein [Nocardioides sp.]